MAVDDPFELLRRVYANYARGDFWTDNEIWHPDIEMVFAESFLDPLEHRGYEGMPEALSTWLRAWERWEAELDELVPAPDGRIVALVTFRGFGRTGGAPVETEGTHVWTFDDDGLVTRMEIHASREEANRILGAG
jgi:ketosteroid isomerase-like protein